MQFYMKSSVIEKGLKMRDYKYTLIDIVIGCLVTVIVAFFIIIACASTLHENGIVIKEAQDAVKPVQKNVKAGEIIVREGERVTAEQRLIFKQLGMQ